VADDISVQISAQISQLQSGLSEATNALKQFVSSVEDGMGKATSAGQNFGNKLEGALNLGIFLELEAVATQALEAVEEAFDATLAKAEEFGLSNAKFAKIIGASVEEATGLSAALQGVGVSTEQYETLALRLGQRIGSQETAFKNLHVATRDANNELLGGKAAMDAVFNAMRANPANENAIAFLAAGRQAKAMFDIMRVGQGDIDDLNKIYKEVGVQIGDTSLSAAEQEDQLNRLRVTFEAVGIAIGQKLMPLALEFFKWLNESHPVLEAMGYAVDGVVAVLILFGGALEQAYNLVALFIAPMAQAFWTLGKVIYDALTGHWDEINADVDKGLDKIAESALKHAHDISTTVSDTLAGVIRQFQGPEAAGHTGAYGAVDGQNPAVHGTPKPDTGGADRARKLADEKLAAAEREALEEIKIEEDKNNTLYAMGQITADQFVAQQEALEDNKYKIQLDFLQKKAAADQKDALSYQKDLDAIKLLAETHEEALLKIHDAAMIKKQAMDRQDMEDGIKLLQENLTDKKAELDEEYKQGRLSIEEKSDAERALTLTVEQEILKRLDAEIAGLAPGTAAWKAAMKERENIVREFSNDIKKITNDEVNADMAKWKTLGTSIASSFNNALNGLLTGTLSWRQALGQIIDSIANAFLTMGEQIVENWIAQQIEKEIFTKATETGSALGQISAAAGVAGANAYAATAAIPIVGPELAPAAAAIAVADTLSFSSLAIAEKGMVLDKDRLVSAHKEEMILPAPLSRGIADMIANGGSRQSGPVLNYNPTVHGPRDKNLMDLLEDQGDDFLAWVQAKHRDGSLRLA
jgi:hypothetical protein